MPRRRSHAVILVALALIPLGIAVARVAQRVVVEPVTDAMPGSLLLAVQDFACVEADCASPSRSLLFWPKRPVAKAFLERDEVSAPPGARGIEHLVVVEAGAQTDAGLDKRTYQASTVPVFEHGT